MQWYCYLFEFVSGLLLANGVPHFVQRISGHRFQSPFGHPPSVGVSSPPSNTLWGFANLMVEFILLGIFAPEGSAVGWILWLWVYCLPRSGFPPIAERQRGFDPLRPS
jgi:hypothetical protein